MSSIYLRSGGLTHHDQIHPVLSATALLISGSFLSPLEDATYEQTMFSPVQSRTVFQSELTHSMQVSCDPNRDRDATGLTLELRAGTLPFSLCAWRGGTSSKTVVMPPGITKGRSPMLASSDERGEGKGEYEDRMKHCKTRQM